MSNNLKLVKAACARIEAGNSRGTGYLVTPDRLVTCAHVLAGVAAGEKVKLHFGAKTYEAMVGTQDASADCAILELTAPMKDAAPLPLASKCSAKDVWDAYGFPAAAGEAQIPLSGIVQDPEGEDPKKGPAILLYSHMIQGAPAAGFSGTPVLVNGGVIGHLKRIIVDQSGERRAEFGLLYACPIQHVQKLLPPVWTEVSSAHGSVQQLKRDMLDQRLAGLMDDHRAASKHLLGEINPVSSMRVQKQLQALEEEMEKLAKQRDAL